jgi:uncharacterized protein with HEPN domain
MNDSRLTDYLQHMAQATLDAYSYIEGLSREDFLTDKRTQQAVVMNLIILGEAATKIMDHHAAFAESHPEVPWRNMRGMRNRIAHGYFEIDLDVVWETARSALPELQKHLSEIDIKILPDAVSPAPTFQS